MRVWSAADCRIWRVVVASSVCSVDKELDGFSKSLSVRLNIDNVVLMALVAQKIQLRVPV